MPKVAVAMISGTFSGMSCGVGDYVGRLAERLFDKDRVDLSVITSKEAYLKDPKEGLRPIVRRWDLRSYLLILPVIKKVRPEIVHIQYPTFRYNKLHEMAIVFLPFVIKCLFPKIKIAVSIHDFSIGHPLSRLKQFPLMAFSDIIVISNERDKGGILKMYPYFRGKLRKIYIGANTGLRKIDDALKAGLKKALCPNDERLIAYFGFLTRGRKLDMLFEAFKKLGSAKDAAPSRLIILGKPQTRRDKSFFRRLRSLAERLDIEKSVIWMIGAPDSMVSAYLQCADLCILPFERGADLRRTTLASCVMHELPVISTVNRRYLEDRELEALGIAKLIEPDKDDLAGTIKGLLDDDGARQAIVRAMRAVKDRFSWNAITDGHISLYEELAGVSR